MAKKKAKKKINKGGRPEKEFDETEFGRMCAIQSTKKEICYVFDCTDKTLEKWCKKTYKMGFSDIFDIKKQSGRQSLRRKGWQMAQGNDKEKPNTAMAIFLMKNHLGMSDRQDIEMGRSFDGFEFKKGK